MLNILAQREAEASVRLSHDGRMQTMHASEPDREIMGNTKIDWCDKVWNVTTGCTKITAGCKNCYAARMAKRLAGRYGYPEAPREFDVVLHPERLHEPLTWKKPQRIFVDSMSDLFHKGVPYAFIHSVWMMMNAASQHTFLILTKRPERMKLVAENLASVAGVGVLPNVWFGVSVSTQEDADELIPWLVRTPAAVRWVSYEPAIEAVDFGRYFWSSPETDIDWLVMGCESGPGARPMDMQWALDTAYACQEAGTAFYLKQAVINGKLVHKPFLNGQQWLQYPT